MRSARHNVPGVTYHLIWRFVDRAWYFEDDEERNRYLHLLGRALSQSDWLALAYALMSNHIHLAIVAGWMPMGAWTKRVNSPFVRWMNDRHKRLGGMFADRAKDHAVLPSREGDLVAYIHNNPVRAGLVGNANESTWTSHRAYLEGAQNTPWLCVDEGLARCGVTSGQEFDAFVNNNTGSSGEVVVDALRKAVRRRGAIHLATPTRVESGVVPLMLRPFGRLRPDPRRVVAICAELTGASTLHVCSRRRSDLLVTTRTVVVHAGGALGLTHSDIASVLSLSVSGVSNAARQRSGACAIVVERIGLEDAK